LGSPSEGAPLFLPGNRARHPPWLPVAVPLLETGIERANGLMLGVGFHPEGNARLRQAYSAQPSPPVLSGVAVPAAVVVG
jgi:hypothetical protein